MTPTLCWIAHRDPANPNAGGAEKSIEETARRLSALGWKVTLITGGFPGAKREDQLGAVEIVRGSGVVGMHFELPQLLASAPPADVVVEDLGHVVPFLSRAAVRAPVVVFFRHLHRRTLPGQVGTPSRLALTLIEDSYRFAYPRGPIVAPSPASIRDLIALGFDPSRLHLIEYGVDSDRFRPGALTARPTLVFFSGLRKYKRPGDALRALQMVRGAGVDADLLMVGRGPELPTLGILAKELGVGAHVRFTGWLGQGELAEVVGQSWVHIQCSMAEGWGLTASEAAAAGVPTVAYDVAGLRESVAPGVSGLLVRDGDTAALAAAVLEVIASRGRWTSTARASVSSSSWDTVARKWDQLLRRVAEPVEGSRHSSRRVP